MKDLWVPVSGALAQQRNVETIANNVANANTPGFKRDQLAFKEYLTALDKGVEDIDMPRGEWKPSDFYRSYGAEKAKVEVDGSFTIHEQGELTPTGNPLDIALHGPGFFEILTPNGIRYTRKGTFTLNNDGFLVTNDGHFVMSKISIPDNTQENASPPPSPQQRKISLENGKLSINLQGEVFLDSNKVNDLSVMEFKDIHALKKEGNSLYISPDQNNIKLGDNKTAIHQGFIEQSNVNAISEMSSLIRANRNFESIQRVIKAYDDISAKTVNELTKF